MTDDKFEVVMLENSDSLPDLQTISSNAEIDNGTLSLLQSVRKFPKVVGYSLGLSIAILLYGFDAVIVGTITAMPFFQQDYGTSHFISYILPATWLALWSAATPLGITVGAGSAGWMQDRFGRRFSMAVGTLTSAIGVAISFSSAFPEAISSRRVLFLVGKLVIGFALGGLICSTQTYVSEIVPTCLRGSLLTVIPTFTVLGQLIGSGVIFSQLKVAGSRSYLVCLASQWVFTAALGLAVLLTPESPVYLVRKSRIGEAVKSQRRLHLAGVDCVAAVRAIESAIEQEKVFMNADSDSKFSDCFKGTNLRRTLIVLFSSTIVNYWGLPLLASASYFLQILGQTPSNSILFLIVGIVSGLVGNAFSIWGVSFFGRRSLMLVTIGVASICWVAVGIAGCFKGNATIWSVTALLMVIILVCGMGVWPVATIISGETSSLHLRGKTTGLSWIVGGLSAGVFNIVTPYLYNPDAGDLGAKAGFFFAGLSLMAAIVIWFFIPEMKGRSPGEIDEMFEQRLSVREFRKWMRGTQL